MMVYDPKAKTTVVLFTTLSATPETAENAAVAVFRQAVMPALGGASVSGSPTGATTTTTG
jgi:hypothetical protein